MDNQQGHTWYSTWNSTQCHVGSLDGRGVWRRMDACVCMAESLHYSPETTTKLLIGYVYAKSLQSCPTPCDAKDCKPTRLLHPWHSPGKITGVGCHCLLLGCEPPPSISDPENVIDRVSVYANPAPSTNTDCY